MIAREALILAGQALIATVGATAPIDVDAELTRLDSSVLTERDAAEVALANSSDFRLTDLEALSKRPGLSPEQRLRLRQVGRQLFKSRPLAGLGVQFGGFGTDGVIIQETIPGFPADDVFQPLDTIRAVNGRRVTTQDDVRWLILSQDVGDVLEIEYSRNGLVLVAECHLGRFSDLPNALPPTDVDLARAFAVRWERRVGTPTAGEPIIGAEISIEQWAQVEAGAPAASARPWPLTRESGSRIVGFGGQPRTSLAWHQAFVEPALLLDETIGAREHNSTVAAVVDRIRSLSRQRALLDERAQTLERHADTAGNLDQRDQFRAMRDEALREIVEVDAQLEGMREILRELRETGR
ncbi:MAG: PDZ domain-containing protein [Leptolyngbya sp. PLA3]|nr:MAG: PDZ domain-containing protein [Cyanobacteria bacterium CYA]MCE7967999.1 PDZ domain-containing protein [Leptolyngbya sp. PL-A3]